ncbi:MAG: hypothetical protein ACRDG8_03215 [Actinomycetota bacterium]
MACADAPVDPGDDDGGIEHGTGPDDLLVRIAFEGGFTPVAWTYTNLPTFSLYGDGTLVLPGAQIEIYPPPALPAISRRQIDEPGVQAILEEALDATGDIPSDLSDLGFMGIADAHTTVVTVSAGGVDRTIRAYALGELVDRPDGMPAEEFRARVRLQELVTRLSGLDAWLPDGSLGPESGYEALASRVFVSTYREVDDLVQQPIAWPIDGGLGGFGDRADASGARCGVVAGEEWTAVRQAASSANELTPWTDAEGRHALLFRPLLPDESSC